MTTREILTGARARLAHPFLWGKGTPRLPEGLDCPGTAVIREAGSINAAGGAFEALTRALPGSVAYRDSFRDVIAFNDAPARTHGEVLALFDRALATA